MRCMISTTIWPSGLVPGSGSITAFTRWTRRSALVKVPLFSRNEDAGQDDVGELRGLGHEDFLHHQELQALRWPP